MFKGVTVKTLSEKLPRLPPSRTIIHTLTRTRLLVYVALTGLLVLAWRGLHYSAASMERYYCYGPAKSPMQLSKNEHVEWNRYSQPPVLFNHHSPLKLTSKSISSIDLNPIKSTKEGIENKERVLMLTPLRNAGPYIEKYVELITLLTYPHDLIDLAFLISDTTDDTLQILSAELDRLQSSSDPEKPFRSVTIIQKDFGATTDQKVEDRHKFEYQGPRRKMLARARNYLLYTALKPDHSWVYWRDVDIVDSPSKILEDLMKHDRDIIVPNIWFHRYKDGVDIEGRFDYNSWQESKRGLALANSLPKDTIIAEGYKELKTGRKHMAKMGDWRYNKDEEIELDGIGGVNILVKADVHRTGINFPAYAFENQAETEGFAKMAKRAGRSVVGLPNYVVWHIDTEEKPGNA